ncbi:hypothetical protein F4823DRAFT_568861 [Ustulina deusta]|nr:hypothetical protein F4823DRAFT_568861 [Ustulina deusta]
MATTAAGIPDDWEHVDDSDNFSVISLPTSEDDAPVPSRDRQVIAVVCKPSDNFVHPSPQPRSENLARSDAHPRDANKEPDRNQAIERCGMDMTDVVEPDTPQAQSREITANENDLDSIFATTVSLMNLMAVILSSPRSHDIKVKSVLLTICAHLDRLRNILRKYAKLRKPENRPADLPVGLSERLGNLKSELLRMEETLNDPAAQTQASQANEYYEKFKSFSSQMDGLMAVIQSDYDDFYKLHFAVLASEDNSHTTSRRRHGRPLIRITPGNNALAHLRRELYTLKDQIVACLGEMQSCEHHEISDNRDQRRNMTALTLSYQKTKESLDLMLSNHGSDWTEYSAAGGLTYQEFCRLNPDTIRSIILQLKEVTDDLFLERCRVQSLRYGNDPDGIFQNEKLIINDSIINTLRATEELLISILQLRKDA